MSILPGGGMVFGVKQKKPKLLGLLKVMGNQINTLNGRILLHAPIVEEVLQSSGELIKPPPDKEFMFSHGEDTAHLVTSLLPNGKHKPTLDIDMPCVLEQSATPGKFHLFIDKDMSKDDYDELLKVLVKVGIVQEGVYELQFVKQGFTAVRLPGVSKLIYKDGKKVLMKKPGTYAKDCHELSSDPSSPFG